jgi:hypothetical protein
MIDRRTLTLSGGLAAMLAAGAVLLAGGRDAYATKITHGGCHEVSSLICPGGENRPHPPPGGHCRVEKRWVC